MTAEDAGDSNLGKNWPGFDVGAHRAPLQIPVLRLVTKTLLMAIFLHPLAAFMFGNFRFASFLQ
jgi:hypothetical protein